MGMISIYQVDAFTNTPFTGNPAGVCILPGPADETWMRNVAREGKKHRDRLGFDDYLSKRSADPNYTLRQHLRVIGGAIEE